jgi:hypothetical protein
MNRLNIYRKNELEIYSNKFINNYLRNIRD